MPSITVTGQSAAFAQALHANPIYRQRADGSSFIALDREPSIDLDLAVSHISGLNEYLARKHDGNINGSGPAIGGGRRT